ncbi:UDP-N-acetylmuramate--L-alanine ligase, partial [Acidobacteria bacterium AH-259-O06]|nr:UDP-N-acetylmuramate--L-alanine ligase [Acidobacteria bacterium AH-259-O06]
MAEILLCSGREVSGSDLKDSPLLKRLRAMGARISIGHDASNLGEAEAVIFSSAVPAENPELAAARNRGLPIMPRGQMLAELMHLKKGITVSGTHGKTTTTSMIALILLEAGVDPTILIGAQLEAIGSSARLGKGEWFVAETDESDRSFLMLSPLCTVITNIDLDHMDEYQDLGDLQQAFLEHMHRVPVGGLVVACADDSNLTPVLKKLHRPVITYGLGPGADIFAQRLELTWLRSSYQCYEKDQCLGAIELSVPGRHNVLNSLAALAVGLRLIKAPFELIQRSLAAFRGAERRLQWKGEKDGVWV